jgi:hypothetical protein
MTQDTRKYIAQELLRDPDSSIFRELGMDTLTDFYGAARHEVVPSTLVCAKEEARRILGESEASKLTLQSLKRNR